MSAPVRQEWSTLAPPAYEPVNQVAPVLSYLVLRSRVWGGWRITVTLADGEPVASAWALKLVDARRAVDGYVATYLGQVTR